MYRAGRRLTSLKLPRNLLIIIIIIIIKILISARKQVIGVQISVLSAALFDGEVIYGIFYYSISLALELLFL
jgi:hypothetical protein